MSISLRQGPPATALFMDYLDNWSRVREFYPNEPSLDAIKRFARGRQSLDPAHRERLCAVLSEQQRSWGASERGVEKLAAGAVAVVTGQQPVLFGGPHLSILKAISAVKIAAELERDGIRAVPVFWVAAEDHDHEEIESTWILNRNTDLVRLKVDLSNPEPTPAGWAEFRPDVETVLDECLQNLPQSEFIPEIADLLRSSYGAGVSPVSAFARFMARLFAGTEMTFLDPLHPGMRVLAQPTIELAIRRNSELRAAAIARSRALTAAGYHEQVKVDENFTGFFAYRGRARYAVRPGDLRPDMQWSPNVLLRPVMQDSLLPSVAYVAGPAEVAYFAQAAAVYQALDRPLPPVFPRITATLIEPRIARTADKYGIEFSDVLRGKEYLKRKAVDSTDDGELFERLRSRVHEEIDLLRPRLDAVDATLIGALETSRQKILHQIETLKGKYVSAAARRDETLERHLQALVNSLFPEKKLQERLINYSTFLARYGPGITPRLIERLRLDTKEHQLVEI